MSVNEAAIAAWRLRVSMRGTPYSFFDYKPQDNVLIEEFFNVSNGHNPDLLNRDAGRMVLEGWGGRFPNPKAVGARSGHGTVSG